MQNQQQVIFIRHAQSRFNQQTLDYVTRKQMAYDWQHLSKDSQFLESIKYSFHLLDASITNKGQKQCIEAKINIQKQKPDIILVSPLNRALQTCQRIFPEAKCEVKVEPILAQGLRSSCDFSSNISQKKKQYSSYNFQKLEKQGQFWFIQNESEQNKQIYKKIIEQNKQQDYQSKLKIIFKYMLETNIYQTPTNLRHRTNRVKLLLKQYSQKYKNIFVVSHYNIIRFIRAKQFNEKDQPFHSIIKNCQIIKININDL